MTGVPCAAFRPSQARVLCASAPLPEPWALLLWPGPQRQLRPLRVSPLRALQEARQGRRAECVSVPGQRRRRSLRNKAKVRTTRTRPGLFVFSVCARISHPARRDVEEQAAPATADPVEGAKQDVPPSVLLLRCFARFPSPAAGSCRSPTTARRCHQRTTVRANTVGRGRASQRQRGSGEVGRKGQKGRRKGRDGRKEGRQGQGRARQGQQEVDKAKEAAKASVPAGRGQAGASACAVVAAFPHGRRAFSCGPTVFAFWGHALLSARIPLVVKPFSLCWLAALRGAGGAF